jgi:hypothetical protein
MKKRPLTWGDLKRELDVFSQHQLSRPMFTFDPTFNEYRDVVAVDYTKPEEATILSQKRPHLILGEIG